MSAAIDTCFNNIIGLSRTDCDCFTAGMPSDASESKSGIYLDELEGLNLNMVSSAADCEGLWQMMEAAREEAIRQTRADLLACITAGARIKRQPYHGIMGEYLEARNLMTSGVFNAAVIQFAAIAGGYFKIKRIGTKFDTTGTITVDVYDRFDSVAIASVVLNTEAGKLKWNDFEFLIDELKKIDGANQRLYFIYQTTFKPYNTAASCGCGANKPVWNTLNPCYNVINNKDYGWASYAMLGGAKGASIADRESWQYVKETYGLVFDVEIGCRAEQTICKDEFNFQSDPYAITIAHAVRFKAGELLMQNIGSKANPNYYTLVIPEKIDELKAAYRSEYENRLYNYLCIELTSSENLNRYSDCYTCKDSYGFQLSGIWK
jgi:hypothetical protein